MMPEDLDDRVASGDDSGLWAAEKLVAAEAADVDAGGDAVFDGRFDARERMRPGRSKVPAPEILRDRHLEAAAQCHELGEGRPLREAFDPEVRRMHAEDQRRAVANGRGVVGGPGL